MLYNAALVLEGGAFRDQYTAGVLDCFLNHHIEFQSVIGVSAGALCGACYVAKQYNHVNAVNTGYRHDSGYVSMLRGFKRQDILNLDFLFTDHGWNWHTFDYAAYERSASSFTAVATSLITSKRIDFTNYRRDKLIDALKASCSLPFLSNPQATDQGPCLDGGLADPIPTDLAKEQGFDRIVVVRTQTASFRKKPTSKMIKSMYRRKYKGHPQLIEKGINNSKIYNQRCDEIDHEVKKGNMYLISPQQLVKVGRLEGNTKKLANLHDTGMSETEQLLPDLIEYLEK